MIEIRFTDARSSSDPFKERRIFLCLRPDHFSLFSFDASLISGFLVELLPDFRCY